MDKTIIFKKKGFNDMRLKKHQEDLIQVNQFIEPQAEKNEEIAITHFLKESGWSLFTSIREETDDTRTINERNNFRTLTPRRGRKKEKISAKIHGSDSFDNLQRKIQVNFQTFAINFCNDCLKRESKYSRCSFKQINYKCKTTVKFSYVSKLKTSSIKDLLEMEISEKYKNFSKNENKELLSRLKGTWLYRLFEMNYLELFKYYYNNGQPLNKIVFENKEIILSPKTKSKSFYYLLEKYKSQKQKIIETVKCVYFNDNDSSGSLFSTTIMP